MLGTVLVPKRIFFWIYPDLGLISLVSKKNEKTYSSRLPKNLKGTIPGRIFWIRFNAHYQRITLWHEFQRRPKNSVWQRTFLVHRDVHQQTRMSRPPVIEPKWVVLQCNPGSTLNTNPKLTTSGQQFNRRRQTKRNSLN